MKRSLVLAMVTGFFAGGAIAGNPVAGEAKSKICAACHGADGNSASADFPRLAGQQADYLVKAMSDYKSGARKNAIMAPQMEKLSKRDMEDIAAFYSRKQGLVVKY